MVDASAENWGDDVLPGRKTIKPGRARRWKVDEGFYSVLMDDCDQTPIGQELGVAVFEAITITLASGGSAPWWEYESIEHNPSNATIDYANFEVVEPATQP